MSELVEIIEQPKLNGSTPPIKITAPYQYSSLKRRTCNESGKRSYETPDGDALPSVTTILDSTKDKTHLISWRKRLGNEKANQEVKKAVGIGTVLHNHLEKYLLGHERPSGTSFARKLGKDMSDIIIARGLPNIKEIWGVEAPLYYPGLYAGTSDLLAIHHEKPAIIDFKNSKKIKKEEWITDYYLQGCAYAMAHNALFGTNIKNVSIFMVSRELEYKEFILEGTRFQAMCDLWSRRVEMFFTNQGKL